METEYTKYRFTNCLQFSPLVKINPMSQAAESVGHQQSLFHISSTCASQTSCPDQCRCNMLLWQKLYLADVKINTTHGMSQEATACSTHTNIYEAELYIVLPPKDKSHLTLYNEQHNSKTFFMVIHDWILWSLFMFLNS